MFSFKIFLSFNIYSPWERLSHDENTDGLMRQLKNDIVKKHIAKDAAIDHGSLASSTEEMFKMEDP